MNFLECLDALGMENGAISDGQISASSQWDVNHAAIQGRLHFEAGGGKQGAWVARKTDGNPWLQVDLGNTYTRVSRVATQGRNAASQWVTAYKLQHSNDGVNFQYYREQGKTQNKVCLCLFINSFLVNFYYISSQFLFASNIFELRPTPTL